MTFSGSASKGAWINPSGITAWTKAAAQFAQMSDKVEDSAKDAVSKTILDPVKSATQDNFPEISEAFGIFYDGEQPYVGIQGDVADEARIMEYGTESQSPNPVFRFALADNRKQANQTFQQGLL